MSTTAKPKKPIDRPFAAKHLKAARAAVDSYEITVRHEEGEWVAEGVELHTCLGSGATPAAAIKECREVMETTLVVMAERGDAFPAPAKDEKRTEQVNLRLTIREKLRLESQARSQGFRGVSDFIRALIAPPRAA